jgi:hypothetical protein
LFLTNQEQGLFIRRNTLQPDAIEIPPELQSSGLHPAEQKLLALIRQVGHGILAEVRIADGLPVFVKELQANIKLL